LTHFIYHHIFWLHCTEAKTATSKLIKKKRSIPVNLHTPDERLHIEKFEDNTGIITGF